MLAYKGLAGSKLYGTATPESDTDYVEVYIPDKDDIFGLGDKWKGMKQETGEIDYQRFTVNKYMKLIMKGNPNALETVFCTESQIEFLIPAFHSLIYGEEQNMNGVRHILNKTHIVKAHLGFALQQTHKMLPAKAKWAGPRREELFDKYGYDVKYAAHAIRLVHQCLDILENGFITYPYEPSVIELIRHIRAGEATLSWVRGTFACGMEQVQKMEKIDCAIDNTDKTTEANKRLFKFYQQIGYAQKDKA